MIIDCVAAQPQLKLPVPTFVLLYLPRFFDLAPALRTRKGPFSGAKAKSALEGRGASEKQFDSVISFLNIYAIMKNAGGPLTLVAT